MGLELKEIKVGDTLTWERDIDRHRGTYQIKRGVVLQKHRFNIEVDQDGTRDWWWWPTIRHCNPQIESESTTNRH